MNDKKHWWQYLKEGDEVQIVQSDPLWEMPDHIIGQTVTLTSKFSLLSTLIDGVPMARCEHGAETYFITPQTIQTAVKDAPGQNDGGPAFPHMMATGHRDYASGLSLRDWFAGQALASEQVTRAYHCEPGHLARYCYEIADAMLAERKKQ